MIITLIAPFLSRLLRKEGKVDIVVLICLILVNIALNIYGHITNQILDVRVPQFLRLNIWIMYYFAGGVFGKYFSEIRKFLAQHFRTWIFATGIAWVLLVIVGNYWLLRQNYYLTEWNYTDLLTILVTFLVFGLSALNYTKGIADFVEFATPLTMGVYIIHPTVLKLFNKMLPGYLVIEYVGILVCSFLCVWIMRKIKVTKWLVSL